jgi:hypothetical protein
MKVAVNACATISFDVELGKEGKFREGYLLVLVASNMFKGSVHGKRMEGINDCLDYIPIRFEGGVRNGVLNGALSLDSGN